VKGSRKVNFTQTLLKFDGLNLNFVEAVTIFNTGSLHCGKWKVYAKIRKSTEAPRGRKKRMLEHKWKNKQRAVLVNSDHVMYHVI